MDIRERSPIYYRLTTDDDRIYFENERLKADALRAQQEEHERKLTALRDLFAPWTPDINSGWEKSRYCLEFQNITEDDIRELARLFSPAA